MYPPPCAPEVLDPASDPVAALGSVVESENTSNPTVVPTPGLPVLVSAVLSFPW